MNSTIRTYDDLLAEKHRLQALLQSQKQLIRYDIDEIKEELAPLKSTISFIGKLTTKDNSNPLITGTVNTVIDLVVKKLVLARSGWFTRLVVPFLLKNYSSHNIDENKDSIISKVFSWFKGKKNKNEAVPRTNGRENQPIEEEEED